MPRRPALVTQADIARIIRAAKQAGAVEVVVRVRGEPVVVRLKSSTAPETALEESGEIVL